MKIYVAHSRAFDFEHELYEPLRNSPLAENHELIFPHAGAAFSSKELIKDVDMILAEVSYPSTGEGIELGWADDLNKHIVCVYKKDANISGSLSYLRAEKIVYSDIPDLLA